MNNNYMEPGPEIPIFLRKTYALVEACTKEAPTICSWTNDGTTFTIFDQEQFEQTQIPLYFKHSKFSSFVRQLNFYSFRKIKDDVIRIDMERATQNHWKFKHALFQRGQPSRMADMKRMTGKTGKQNTKSTNTTTTSANANATGTTNSTTTTTESPEVRALQQRIEEMNKNIHALTAMVEKVSLQQEKKQPPPPAVESSTVDVVVGSKRKKLLQRSGSSMQIEDDETTATFVPESVASSSSSMMAIGSSSSSPMLFSDDTIDNDDDAFVDELFQAFHDDAPLPDDTLSSETTTVPSNRPDPQLMQKLSDCLEMLPKPIQEMIVNRLIDAITEGLAVVVDESESHTTLAALVSDGAKKLKATLPVIPVHV